MPLTFVSSDCTDTPQPNPALPLTTDRTRIAITSTHRPFTKRPVRLTDALDFWSFAGAAADVIMQMARPGVGYGVAESKVESGSLMKRPWKRARATTQHLVVAIFAPRRSARPTARRSTARIDRCVRVPIPR